MCCETGLFIFVITEWPGIPLRTVLMLMDASGPRRRSGVLADRHNVVTKVVTATRVIHV